MYMSYKSFKLLERFLVAFPVQRTYAKVVRFDSIYACKRCLSSMNSYATDTSKKWNRAIVDAEKLVGYSNLQLGLNSLPPSDMVTLFEEIRKLMGSSHPLLRTVKNLIYNDRTNFQIRGLIVTLFAIIIGTPPKASLHSDGLSDIFSNQKQLAHITEMIYMANAIHKSIVNLSSVNDEDMKAIVSGNKTAILVGDYLLARTCLKLSDIRNSEVFSLMAVANQNIVEGQFNFEQDRSGKPYPTKLTTLQDWEKSAYSNCGSLLARSCVSAAVLAGHDKSIQEGAYDFGTHFGLTWQVYNDLSPFLSNHQTLDPSCLFSIPVIMHLQKDPTLLDLILPHSDDLKAVNYSELFSAVKNGPGINKAKQLGEKYAHDTAKILQKFKDSGARQALEKIVYSMVLI